MGRDGQGQKELSENRSIRGVVTEGACLRQKGAGRDKWVSGAVASRARDTVTRSVLMCIHPPRSGKRMGNDREDRV